MDKKLVSGALLLYFGEKISFLVLKVKLHRGKRPRETTNR